MMIDPIEAAFSVTPNDDENLTRDTRGVYVAGTGDLKVELVAGSIITFGSIAAGVIHPIRVRKVYSTGTTASGIIGVY